MRNVLLQRVLDILLLSIFKLENRLGALSSPQHMVNREATPGVECRVLVLLFKKGHTGIRGRAREFHKANS